ncbi:MAG: hypothetical protein ABFC90_01010 [Bacteroidales bacterium]|nr:hypothetical protein [Bacteroidales bacterium]
MKRVHDLSLTQVNNYLASYIEYLNVKIKNNEMKKIIFILLTTFLVVSCDRNLDFDTISTTDPSLEVLVEGAVTNNTYPKINGATVKLYNSDNQLLATKTTDATGKVIFTEQELAKEGKFKVVATKGALNGEGETAYMLLNDGVTLIIISII